MILQRRIGDAAGIGYSNTVLCARCKCHDGNVTAAAIGAAPLEVGPECQNRWKKRIPRGGTALAERYGNMLRPLPMKATILSHEAVPIGADSSEVHRFTFVLDDGQTLPRSRVISLRTARVLVAELKDADAFVKMLREIVRTDPADFDSLPGQIFTDGDAARPDAEPLQP
jgi:hypothetical protein